MIYSFYSIPLMLGIAFLIPILAFKHRAMSSYLTIAGSGTALIFAIATIPEVLSKKVLVMQMEYWIAPFGITIAVDSLTIFLVLIITLIGFLVTIFSLHFIKQRRTEYYCLISLLLAGLLGVVHTGDLFNLYVFFEIICVAAYALTAYYKSERAVEASIKYLITGAFGTSLVLFGIAFLYGLTGTLNMADLSLKIPTLTSPILPVALGLLLTGFGFKAAIVPFHAWKPDVITATPPPIGAIFTTAVTSVGIYTILRILLTVFSIFSNFMYSIILVAGVITMITGAILALQQTNLLRLLAYSAISQVGYVLVAFGIGIINNLGFTAAIFHLFNFVLFEALFFFCGGIILMMSGTLDMTQLGGLGKVYPALNYSFIIGMLAAVGVPFLNGFSSKWLIYISTLQTYPVLTIITVLISVLTFAYFLKAYHLIFLGNKKIKYEQPHKLMFVPLIVLSVLCLFFGIFPELGIQFSEIVTQSFNNALYIGAVLG